MSSCRICRADLPEYQAFCSQCGARRSVFGAGARAKDSIFVRLKDLVRYFFRSEEEKEADKHMEASYSLAVFSAEATIREHPVNSFGSPKPSSTFSC